MEYSKARENEANQFAMELLMPKKFIEKSCEGMAFDVENSKNINKLAKEYDVSEQLMTIRLTQLGYLKV